MIVYLYHHIQEQENIQNKQKKINKTRTIKEAAKELGITVDYDGTKNPDSYGQKDIIEKWLKKGINAIVVSANDPNTLVPLMKKAQVAGIKTSTWNSDIISGREYFLNQTSDQRMGKCLVDMMTHSLNSSDGDYLIVTSSLDSPNQSQWLSLALPYLNRH